MGHPPEMIDGARVLRFAIVDDACRPTGACRHSVGGSPVGPAAALAIARYPDDPGYYRFSCAAD